MLPFNQETSSQLMMLKEPTKAIGYPPEVLSASQQAVQVFLPGNLPSLPCPLTYLNA